MNAATLVEGDPDIFKTETLTAISGPDSSPPLVEGIEVHLDIAPTLDHQLDPKQLFRLAETGDLGWASPAEEALAARVLNSLPLSLPRIVRLRHALDGGLPLSVADIADVVDESPEVVADALVQVEQLYLHCAGHGRHRRQTSVSPELLTGFVSTGDLAWYDLRQTQLNNADLSGFALANSVMSGMNLWGLQLRNASASGANFWGSQLAGADMADADLRLAILERAVLNGASLRGADLRKANLWGASLIAADLGGVDLRGADLSGAVLCGADLSGADLSGADLRNSDLRGAILNGSNLTRADLRKCDLSRTDLRDASLIEADVCGAQMTRADTRGASMRGAVRAVRNGASSKPPVPISHELHRRLQQLGS